MSRTIIVGDIHGCREEFERLLDRLAFQTGDRLVLVGDLIARGPDSAGVLRIARQTGADIVRGNHEERLLAGRRGEARLSPLHSDVANSLSDTDWALLEATPLTLAIPEHDVLVVHAGLDPALPLEAQPASHLLFLRTVPDPAGGPAVLWASRYEHGPHVLFGHHAMAGLQLHRRATGLDTGCVYGGKLTALVLHPGEHVADAFAARRNQLVQVDARRAYFVGKDT
jgi:hypothetical protein